ncbi:MAG: sulfatase [Melioribacteraceae bacterium]|nr:sulfatase [Melioribacteraceae bacterium]
MNLIKVVLVLIVSGIFLNSLAQSDDANVLFIIVDDLRPELNCYGVDEVKSPNIDKLASEGYLFENAYCQVPVCGASRASILSGLRPERNRFVNYFTWLEKDAPEIPSLPAYFKENGYTTLSNGKIFHHLTDSKDSWSEDPHQPDGRWRDYQSAKNISEAIQNNKTDNKYLAASTENADVDDNAYWDGIVTDKTIKDLKKFKETGEKFFIAYGLRKPHLPFNAPKKYWDLYNREDIKLADNPFIPKDAPEASMHTWGELRAYTDIPNEGPVSDEKAKELIHGYYACTSYIDAQIGKVMEALVDLELDKNTVIVFVGDHGWQLGEHSLWCKHSNYDTSLKSPMLIKVPGLKNNIRISELTEFIDVYPTLCSLTGLSLPEHLQGDDLSPLLNGNAENWKDAVYSRFHDGESVKTEKYLYTEFVNDSGEIYDRMLYDHKNDPDENTNVAELPEYKEIVKKHSKLLASVRK